MSRRTRFVRGLSLGLALLGLSGAFTDPARATPGHELLTETIHPWPMFQGNPAHNGQSGYVGVTTRPLVRWMTTLPGYCGESGSGMSQAANGTVFVSACGKLSAIDALKGTILWTYDQPVIGHNRSTPALDPDGTIYWGYAGYFLALTPIGDMRWGWSGLMNAAASSAVYSGELLAFTSNGIIVLDRSTGDYRWSVPYSDYTYSSPAIDQNGNVFVGTYQGLYGYTSAGSPLMYKAFGTVNSSPSVGADGVVYIGGYDGELRAYGTDGELHWQALSDETQYPTNSMVLGPPTVGVDETIYFATMVTPGAHAPETGIYAVNSDGTRRWRVPITRGENGNSGIFAPMVIDREGHLYACSENARCYGIDASGKVLWEMLLPGWIGRTAPLISADGALLVLDTNAHLYSLTNSTYAANLPMIVR